MCGVHEVLQAVKPTADFIDFIVGQPIDAKDEQ